MGGSASAGDVDGTSIQGGTDGTTIGNVADALKVVTTGTQVTQVTYSSGVVGLVPGANPTDVFTIIGSASKTIYVTQIGFSVTATGTNTRDFSLVKRSTANSGGTSTTRTAVPHDSSDAAATAVVRTYTANPTTLGTAVGTMRAVRLLVASGTAAQTQYVVWDFGQNGKPVILRGVAETLALNAGGVTLTSGSLSCWFEWWEV